jgi:hypothetical protein
MPPIIGHTNKLAKRNLSLAQDNQGEAPLTESDFRGLAAIPRDIIEAAGLFRVDTLRGAEAIGRRPQASRDYAGILFPYRWPGDSRPRGYRLRRDHPDHEQKADGTIKLEGKYLHAPGDANRIYFPPTVKEADLSSEDPIIVTEGEKKALALAGFYRDTLGQPALIIGLSGVWNWRGTVGKTVADNGQRVDIKGPLPDLDAIRWTGRDVFIIFDADIEKNAKVATARRRLRNDLIHRGGKVRLVDIPPSPNGVGVDDLLSTPGGPKALETLIDNASRETVERVLFCGNPKQDLTRAAADVWEALERTQRNNPSLFWWGGILHRGERYLGKFKLDPCTPDLMSYELTLLGEWWRGVDPEEKKWTHPPTPLVRHLLSAPRSHTPHPTLNRIVYSPVFTARGDLLTSPGFHPESGIYYCPTFEALPVPDVVSDADLQSAKELIDGWLLYDFPFATGADRCHAVGLLLLPFVREMIEGATPLHLIEASTPGSGKGLLANALLFPALGDSVTSISQPTTEEEWGKALTGALLSGRDAVWIDNLATTLDSGKLSAALTAARWDDRVLGGNKGADMPIRCAWVATGNNPLLSQEMARRCARIRLEPDTDRPEERSGFKVPELPEWVAENRPRLVQAALVMVRHWIQSGRPGPADGTTEEASYRVWWRTMGGILSAAGYKGFWGNRTEFRERADTERTIRAAFCHEWWQWAEREWRHLGATTAELLTIAQGMEMPIHGNTEAALSKSLGIYLQRCVGQFSQYVDPDTKESTVYRISAGKMRKGSRTWILDRG